MLIEVTNIQKDFEFFLPLGTMAGIYVHIPFCRQKCHYCNFHFSVSVKNKDALIESILREIEMSSSYLKNNSLDTLYFGGGTPSLLNGKELGLIMKKLREFYTFREGMEITLEANPDDLDPEYLEDLLEVGINRLSIGIQSFHQDELEMMNRAHNVEQAKSCITAARSAGFEELSIDLIFGMPDSNMEKWAQNLEKALSYDIPHYSIYNLTIEKRTALHHFVEKGSIKNLEEEMMARQFLYTIEEMEKQGFEHYEISNYALPGKYAVHNTSYWQGESYLGLGPSAHSFNGESRRWNVANNARYIKSIGEGKLPFESELLSLRDRYNEYVLTGFRTQWGCDLDKIRQFGDEYCTYFMEHAKKEMVKGRIVQDENKYCLSREGKLFGDEISSSLFLLD